MLDYIENIKNSPQVDLKISNYNFQGKPLANLLSNFDTTIKNARNPEDLALYYRNISHLKIKVLKNEKNFKDIDTLGLYNSLKNQIKVYEKLSGLIYHELFHMASSYTQEKMIYSGFVQKYVQNKKIVCIGEVINEGYTELLTERYFGNVTTDGKNNYGENYQIPIYFGQKLEQIIGQESMEKLYLTADLKGLVKNLQKFNSDSEIIYFLNCTDILWQHLTCDKIDTIKEAMRYANYFLLNTYLKKLIHEKIPQTEMVNRLLNFVSVLMDEICFEEKTFHTFTDEDVEKTITLTLKKSK